MKCPRDGTELQTVSFNGVVLDKCHQCDGIFFDHGELEKISKMGIPQVEEIIEDRFGNPPVKQGTVDGFMRCPKCPEGRLSEYQYTYLKPVRIDRCDLCLGLWLDNNELNEIIGEKKELKAAETQSKLKTFVNSLLKSFSNN